MTDTAPPAGLSPLRRCGQSGLQLSPLGLNLSPHASFDSIVTPCLLDHAMDLGVTHFDVTALADHRCAATQRGRFPASSAWLDSRNKAVITARVGMGTQPGPLTGFGSRKQVLTGLDSVLHRTGLTYIDVLYAHRFDSATPLQETAQALASTVQQGKALYVGLSSFAPASVRRLAELLAALGTPVVAYQTSYSLMNRWIEDGLLDVLTEYGIGCVAAAPLSHGQITSTNMPAQAASTLAEDLGLPSLRHIAASRGQSVAQLAISWALRDARITSVLTSTAQTQHLMASQEATRHCSFTADELAALDLCYPIKHV
ncbi:aldo/keto reductase [Streptomyces sp. NPDC094438]|uniref:aldo/keto reductase n=1 Tax=Streptomyces sp. NPDC094438 TaxID=3366061 RepID=UPI0037FDD2D6